MPLRRADLEPIGPAAPSLPVDASTPTGHQAVAASDGVWSTLSVAGVACAVLSEDTTVVWANPSMGDLIGTRLEQLVGRPLAMSLGAVPGDAVAGPIAAATRHGRPIQRLAVVVPQADGSTRKIHLSAAETAAWGRGRHTVVVVEAPSPHQPENRSKTGDVRAGTVDVLTGLPGRATFESLLVSALRDAAGRRQPFALLIGDLDGFRHLNERYGPTIGDQVLQWVAQRLSSTLHHHDTMGRLGGDEFVIIAERVPNLETACAVGRRLAAAVSEPIAGSEFGALSMSVGITLATGRERPVDLLAEADRALQFARARGTGSVASLDDAIRASAPVAASPEAATGKH